jgi:hypothetical protein
MVTFWKAFIFGLCPKIFLGVTWMDETRLGAPLGGGRPHGEFLLGAALVLWLPLFTLGKCVLHGLFWYFEYPSYPLVFLSKEVRGLPKPSSLLSYTCH